MAEVAGERTSGRADGVERPIEGSPSGTFRIAIGRAAQPQSSEDWEGTGETRPAVWLDGKVRPADEVLDVAAGTGTFTFAAAARGARALDLNRAYSHLVRHQSFIRGRDAIWIPAKNVFSQIEDDVAPLDAEHRLYGWDLRLVF